MENDLKKTLAANLLKARKSRKWTQERIADKIGISPRSYQAIEYEEAWPSAEVLTRIGFVLDMPVWLLLSGDFTLIDNMLKDIELLHRKVLQIKNK